MGQQGQAVLFLLPSEKGYIDKLQQHGVKVQQGNLTQHVLQLQELGTAPQQVCSHSKIEKLYTLLMTSSASRMVVLLLNTFTLPILSPSDSAAPSKCLFLLYACW